MLCGARELPSASEVLGDTSEKDKEVEIVPGAPTPPLLKSCPVVIRKMKMQQTRVIANTGYCRRGAAPSPGGGALCLLLLHTGRADGSGPSFSRSPWSPYQTGFCACFNFGF